MPAPTTSTIVTVKTQLVVLAAAALVDAGVDGAPVPVSYAWPGPETGAEHVFLGRHPELDDIRLDADQEIPTIKAGRKQRQENYDVQMTVWTFRPDLDPIDARECEARAFDLVARLENVLADDVQIGLPDVVQYCRVDTVTSTLFPFNSGWADEVLLTLAVAARLR